MKMGKDLPQSESIEQKAKALRSLISGPLPSSASRLLSLARGLPSDKDFHFYNNFDEFKLPAREIAAKTESSLGDIASSSSLWGSRKPPPVPGDLDDAYDWLVNVNDDLLEKFGAAMDDFRSSREKQEQTGAVAADSEDGFQLVYGKKKKRETLQKSDREVGASDSLGIKIVSRDKKTTARTKVPFHLPDIPRPQEEFNILVNNKNLPFEHVWLGKSEDGSRFVHPLEKLSVIDFPDKNIKEDEIIKPFPLASTQFKLIEGVKELKKLAARLHEVNEFAVDLEHNQYRSFLGLTCLMQISTRTEDFIIDTLKLRVQIGPYLRQAFKDPLKRKIMHGADRDILWLQRDFGIYVCNLFDTGQASRLLQLERNSLQYLLRHFCDIEANKEYQNADWRLRPLPDEMIKYAREDTHYLLHIYDLMRCKLLSLSSDDNDRLLEVYKRSSQVCMQLYEKEILTDISYRYIYGLSEADFDSKQLAIVAGLCQWRDTVAREEDESTGYILPNKALLEIARQMSHSSGKLRRLVKSRHQYVERHLNTVLKVIKNAIADSSAFESIAEELRQARIEASAMQISEAENNIESVTHTENAMECSFTKTDGNNDSYISTSTNQSIDQIASVCSSHEKQMQMSLLELTTSNCDTTRTVKKEIIDNGAVASQLTEKVTPAASIQAVRKPTCGFGALFRKTSAGNTKPLKGNGAKQENESKVAQIKASVILPFYPFSSEEKLSEPNPAEHVAPTQTTESPDQPSKTTTTEDVIPLGNGTDSLDFPDESQKDVEVPNGEGEGLKTDADTRGRCMSLSDLSSGFQQCFQSINERRNSEVKQMPPQEPQYILQLTPFDYAAAWKAEKLGESDGETGGNGDVSMADGGLLASMDVPKSSLPSRRNGEQRERGQQPRRRQAFPPTGNRSTTYRC